MMNNGQGSCCHDGIHGPVEASSGGRREGAWRMYCCGLQLQDSDRGLA